MITWNDIFQPQPCDHDWTPWRRAGDAETCWCRKCTLGAIRFSFDGLVADYTPEKVS